VGDVYVDIDQQSGATGGYFAIRTTGDPRQAIPAIRDALATLDPEVPVYDAVTMVDRVQSVESYARFTTLVLSIAGAIALTLAVIGIVGTLAFAVRSRRREIGIRMALGATRGGVIALFLGDGLLICALGFTMGVPLAAASARAMRSALFEVGPSDPASSAAAALLLIVAAVIACAVPAQRAAAVDPARVLRD
jgi:putative ABC transport system permease protein